jgi:glutamate 5-kinase
MDLSFVSAEKSNFGRGGMITKSKMSLKLAQMGIAVHLANGKRDDILKSILMEEDVGTLFVPRKDTSQVKRWVATSEGYAKGKVVINEGAAHALCQQGKATSLLPIGVSAIEGSFEPGDVVKVVSEVGAFIGMGVAK